MAQGWAGLAGHLRRVWGSGVRRGQDATIPRLSSEHGSLENPQSHPGQGPEGTGAEGIALGCEHGQAVPNRSLAAGEARGGGGGLPGGKGTEKWGSRQRAPEGHCPQLRGPPSAGSWLTPGAIWASPRGSSKCRGPGQLLSDAGGSWPRAVIASNAAACRDQREGSGGIYPRSRCMERGGWWGLQGQLLEAKDRSKQGQARVDWGLGSIPLPWTRPTAAHGGAARAPRGPAQASCPPHPPRCPQPRPCCPPSALTGQLLLHTLSPRWGGNPGKVPCRIGWGPRLCGVTQPGGDPLLPPPIWSPGKEVCVSKEV